VSLPGQACDPNSRFCGRFWDSYNLGGWILLVHARIWSIYRCHLDFYCVYCVCLNRWMHALHCSCMWPGRRQQHCASTCITLLPQCARSEAEGFIGLQSLWIHKMPRQYPYQQSLFLTHVTCGRWCRRRWQVF
jgi:hypothetical protein